MLPPRRRVSSLLALLLVTPAVFTLTACAPDPARELADIARAEDQRQAEAPALAQGLTADAPEVRARAVRALGRIQAAESAGPLAGLLDREHAPAVVREILFALGQLGLAEGAVPPPVAVDAVRGLLGDPDPTRVAAAAQALGKLAPAGAADDLIPLLSHADPGVRTEAAYGLFRLRFVPLWRRQVEEAPELPAAAIEALIHTFGDSEPAVRRAAVYAFSRYGEPRATVALVERLADPDPWTRLFAARTLARSGAAAEPALPTLLALAREDESQNVRAEAVAAAGALGGGASLPAELAGDPSFHVRAALARALGKSDSAESLALLRHLFEADPSLTVRAAAVEELAGRSGGVLPGELSALLGDASWVLRAAAARAAGSLGESAGWPLLARAFADPDVRVQAVAVEVLGRFPGTDALLAEALSSPDLAVRGTAVGAVAGREDAGRLPLLTQAYEASAGEEWVEVREGIIDALGTTPAAAGELLTRVAAEDPAPSVRRRAATALEKAGLPAPAVAVAPAIEPSPFLGPAGVGTGSGEDPIVTLETERGTMRIRCFAEAAPIHVANFVSLVKDGFYDGLIFHRVVTNFVIQGGDPRGDGWGGPGYQVRDEIHPIPFDRGTVGMPKAGKDTGGGQIFIDHIPTPHLDGGYTVFGQVIEGLEVLDALEVGDRILTARVSGEEAAGGGSP